MSVHVHTSADEVTISVEGIFDYRQHESFRAAYEQLPDSVSAYNVDLSRTDTLDSSALGMLLLLRDHAASETVPVRLLHCNDSVRETLQVACFDTLFAVA